MKKILRPTAFLAVMMISISAIAQARDLSGTVVDENDEPMPFVNVVLLTMPDSTFVKGCVTDENGQFKISSDRPAQVLRLTCMGYEPLFIATSDVIGQTIRMTEDVKLLKEVVVYGELPKTHVKGDAMRTNIEGTILEKAGSAVDALKNVPSVEADNDGGVKVLGRGDAEVYINGRRVLDSKEVARLRSEQIQFIDVVQNPGARYSASTKAVVRIQLKKAHGDGFSFRENASGIYQYGLTLTNDLNVNYRIGGLDITGSFWAGRFGHSKSLQEHTLTYYAGPDFIEGRSTQEAKGIWKGWSPQLQVNYMINEKHSVGAFYKFDRHPSNDWNSLFVTKNYENGVYTELSESDIHQNDRFKKHIFNAYYIGKVGNLGIDLNIDGLFDNTETPGSTVETTTSADGTRDIRSITSNTKSGNDFWASKLILTYPVCKGSLSVGGEYSYNHRTDAYTYTATEELPVQTTDTEINETSVSTFAEYGRRFGLVFVQAGLRYEHLSNDYFNFGVRQDESCRSYGDWFPTAVISAPIGKVQMALSYRRDIQRPNYSNLTSSTVYINRYTYQSGNPYLKPTYTHSIVFNASYKWLNFNLNFARIKDSETMSTEPFPGASDPLVSLVRPINSNEPYNRFSANLALQPIVGIWHPTWTVYTIFQNYKTPCIYGSTITLNRPFCSLSWGNIFELPCSFRLSLSTYWASKGDYDNFRVTRSRFYTSIGVQHDINLRRFGSLTLDLRCVDVFNSSKTEATVYGFRELTTFNPARRTFMLDITWRFNEADSKYRGSGAGEKQKARM